MASNSTGTPANADAKWSTVPAGKASNAGGVATSGLEMTQNYMGSRWSTKEVDDRLHHIMKNIHNTCLAAAEEYGKPGNYLAGANIAGFLKVARSMQAQGIL